MCLIIFFVLKRLNINTPLVLTGGVQIKSANRHNWEAIKSDNLACAETNKTLHYKNSKNYRNIENDTIKKEKV
jgi:hypothetical protein